MWQSAQFVRDFWLSELCLPAGWPRGTKAEEPTIAFTKVRLRGETLVGIRLDSGMEAFLVCPMRKRRSETAVLASGRAAWARTGTRACDSVRTASAESGNPNGIAWWQKVFRASDPSSIPDLTHMDGNCLYLNIWTAQSARMKRDCP